MKKTLLILLMLTGLLPALAPAARAEHRICIVRSSYLTPYEEARDGFLQVITTTPRVRGSKQIHNADIYDFILANSRPRDLRQEIRRESPDLILAIGTNALAAVIKITDIPILYLMAPFPNALVGDSTNITGVTMDINPAHHLIAFAATLPKIRRVGLLYDPEKMTGLIREATEAANELGIRLIAKPIRDAKDIPAQLNEMAGAIDAFWMLPDSTVLTPQSLEFILLFSLENRLPILSFSEKYLKRGAVTAATFDIKKMGEQAGRMAQKILARPPEPELPEAGLPVPERAEDIRVIINHKVAAKLGLTINEPGGTD